MPISYVLDRATHRVRTTVMGTVTVDDILNHLKAACEEQVLTYSELIDARQAGPSQLSPQDLWLAAGQVRKTEFDRRSLGPRAVVVEDLATFGMVRIFTTLVSDFFPMNVFRDFNEAEAWLAEHNGR